jgi:hypothetical protein
MTYTLNISLLINMKQMVIKMLELQRYQNVVTILFHQHHKEGLLKWVYEDAFRELFLLGQKAWDDDEIKKCRLVQNAQNTGMVDMHYATD